MGRVATRTTDADAEDELLESVALDELIRKHVLPRFPVAVDAAVASLGAGLINRTFLVTSAGERFVLQQVNRLFPASIHDNIHAVTTALTRAGVVTPVLVPTNEGRPCLELGPSGAEAGVGSIWRLMTYVDGVSFDVVAGPAQARAAGTIVARFHAALDDRTSISFKGQRVGVHDTRRHLEYLRQSVAAHAGTHRLFPEVAPLSQQILEGARALPALPDLPQRICHGDLKFSNLLFAGADPPERDRPVCLVDLDTVGPMALAHELGDAWRSWCNRNGEDNEHAALDLHLFEASLDGYRSALAHDLGGDERRAVLLGPEWVSLELAARFAADALAESYFGWDARRFASRGEHNLVRARGQLSLHRALVATRDERARLLGASPSAWRGPVEGRD